MRRGAAILAAPDAPEVDYLDFVRAKIIVLPPLGLDVAQAAYRATLTNLESGLVALASSIESAGGLKLATTLVVDGIEALAGVTLPATAV